MKFNAVLGNPPYQADLKGDNKTYRDGLYPAFIDFAKAVSSIVLFIVPAKFLFNFSSKLQKWALPELQSHHMKVIEYFADCEQVFTKVGLRGGLAIVLWDKMQTFESIVEKYAPVGVFLPYPELESIVKKVITPSFQSLIDYAYSRTSYRYSKKLYQDHPELVQKATKGHLYDLVTKAFIKTPEIFYDSPPDDGHTYIAVAGLYKLQLMTKYIRADYIYNVAHRNINKYKVFVSQVTGRGDFGETISRVFVAYPHMIHTETFMSIGAFDDFASAQAAVKYIKTKFARTMLDILKITSSCARNKWLWVPVQNFTEQSDIDWKTTISEIDQQLYRKYGLNESEVTFIENNVKPMN